MLPIDEILMLAAAGVIYYLLRQLKFGANKLDNKHNEFDVQNSQSNLFNESMKDITSPERHWNATNIHNSNYHRDHDVE